MTEFRILGPFEVVAHGQPVRLGGRKQAALLAILVLGRREVLSSERLIDSLWGERPPATAAKTLQVYIANLRKAIGSEEIETVGRGYKLAVADGAVDADRFEALCASARRAAGDGDPAAARQLLGSALGLWRGEPLADFAYEPFAQAEIGRLGEARLTALEDRIEADLDLARHRPLVAELEGLTSRHPTRERLLASHVLALYRSGRQVDALEAYRRCREALDEELGLEPSPRLRELEQAILRHDPKLEPPSPSPRAVRAPVVRGGALIASGGALLLAAVAVAIALLAGGAARAHGPVANTVAVIDVATNRVVGLAQVGASPGPIAYGSGSIWVGNVEDETVSRVDPRTLRTERTMSLGATPTGIAASPGAVWIVSATPNATNVAVRRIDTEFDQIGPPTRIGNDVPGGPGTVAAAGSSVWVAPSGGELTRLNPASGAVAAQLDPNVTPSGIAVGEGATWVAGGDADNVMRIDRSGLQTPIPVGQAPVAIAAGAGAVWVAEARYGTLVRIDPTTNAVTTTIPVGALPSGVSVGAGSVWVANSGDGTVTRIDADTGKVIATIRVGGSPQGVVVADGRAWVTVQGRAVSPSAATHGGALRVDLIAADIDHMDPALAYSNVSWQLLQATCAQLVNYPDRGGAAGTQPVAEVAQSMPARSDGGKTYTFTIRPGFRFSPPSNAPVTAETFKYTIERSLSHRMASPFDYQFGDIVGAAAYMAGRAAHISGVVVSGDRLIVHLLAPAPDLPTRMAQTVFCAVPVGTPINPQGLFTIPMAGPYYIASYAPGQGVILKRNPSYHGPRPQPFASIDVAVNVPLHRALAQVESGTADYTPILEAGTVARLAARYGPASAAARAGGQRYFATTEPGWWAFDLNSRRTLFGSLRMRQAVNYAVDRTALTEAGSFAGAGSVLPVPTDQYLPPGIPGYHDVAVYPLTSDVPRARALAGGKGGTARLFTCNEPECIGEAQVLRTDLAQIGIHLEVTEFPFQNLYTAILHRNAWDIALFSWAIDYPDPADVLNNLLEGGTLIPRFPNPAVRDRLARAAALSGPERYLTYGALATELDRNVAPWIVWGRGFRGQFFSARVGCQQDGIYGIDLVALCLRRRPGPHRGPASRRR